MTSQILRIATRVLHPLLLLFSIFLLLRGHNEPGGGFVGGLVAASAFALQAIALDPRSAQQALRVSPQALIGAGLVFAALSATLALAMGRPFMTSLWRGVDVPGLGRVELSTPFLFDAGVYLVVIGVTLLIIFTLCEE